LETASQKLRQLNSEAGWELRPLPSSNAWAGVCYE
jgi:hypothetical protein